MDKTLLPSIGIVAGIMTLAYYVGGREEVKWAESHSAEEFDRSPISVPKDWESKDYPYEKRVTAETKFKWCENCGELDDSDEDAWPYYQFVLKQKNSTKPVMRFISGGACEGCGTALCQNCMEGRTSGNFNPLFEPACDDCGYIFCKECKDEDEERCHSCQERYEEDVCDCCGHVHHAESETFESPVTCNICGKTFDSYRGLNGHMNAHKGRYSFIAEGTERDLPVVKIYGENGVIVIGHGVRQYLIQELADMLDKSASRIEESLQKASTQELADMLDKLLKSNGEEGASLEYHDMDGWVGWQIPDFRRE